MPGQGNMALVTLLQLVLLAALASAVPTDITNRTRVFGLPTETEQPNVSLTAEEGRAPATLEEHLNLGAEEDTGPFLTFWQLLNLRAESLRRGNDWTSQQQLEAPPTKDSVALEVRHAISQEDNLKELDLLPDIKIFKYQLPSLPEVALPDFPPPPEMEFPEIKLVKYELPQLPQIDLPRIELPEIELPNLKVLKYELPSFPEVKLPPLPGIPVLELPDINIVKYQLPSLPEFPTLELPPMPEIQLPDLKLIKYELPDLPELKLDLPRFPEFNLPDIKLIKYELPSLPEVKQDWSSFITVPKWSGFKVPVAEVSPVEDDVPLTVNEAVVANEQRLDKIEEVSVDHLWSSPNSPDAQLHSNGLHYWNTPASQVFLTGYSPDEDQWLIETEDEVIHPWITPTLEREPRVVEVLPVATNTRASSKFTKWHKT